MKPLNKYFDHTLLKPEATAHHIKKLCLEAKEYDFYSVCVNSCYVPLAAEELAGSNVQITAVAGFPLGACSTLSKVFETENACKNGAFEIDMVMNIGYFKSGDLDLVKHDIQSVVKAATEYGSSVKVILETCLLTDDEIIRACKICRESGASFVKTSTGFNSSGATVKHIRLMRYASDGIIQVKASGGIRDYNTAMTMIEAGANRIGSSASVEIMKQARQK